MKEDVELKKIELGQRHSRCSVCRNELNKTPLPRICTIDWDTILRQ